MAIRIDKIKDAIGKAQSLANKGQNASPGGAKGSGGSGGYTEAYTGGNAALDAAIKEQSDHYHAAREKGDAAGMQEANNAANQLRNQYGYAAAYADKDIASVMGQPGYSGGGNSGGGSYGGGYRQDGQENGYQQLLEEQQRQYELIRRQEEAAKRAAVEQAVSALNDQKGSLGRSYEDLYRQLYIDRRRAEKDLPQQMSAMGMNGGMTESSALALSTSYAEALRQGEQAKLGTMNGIDQAIADARLTGDLSIADQAARTAREQLASYGSVVGAMQQQNNVQQQFAYQQQQDAQSEAWKDKQWEYGVGQDRYGSDREKALYLAQLGNFSALGSLWGMSGGEVQSLTDGYARQNQTTTQQAARDLADWYAKYGDFSMVKGLGVGVNLGSRSAGGRTGEAGTPAAAPAAGAAGSPGYQSLVRRLAELEDRGGGSMQQIVRAINSAKSEELITSAEADNLYRRYGIT